MNKGERIVAGPSYPTIVDALRVGGSRLGRETIIKAAELSEMLEKIPKKHNSKVKSLVIALLYSGEPLNDVERFVRRLLLYPYIDDIEVVGSEKAIYALLTIKEEEYVRVITDKVGKVGRAERLLYLLTAKGLNMWRNLYEGELREEELKKWVLLAYMSLLPIINHEFNSNRKRAEIIGRVVEVSKGIEKPHGLCSIYVYEVDMAKNGVLAFINNLFGEIDKKNIPEEIKARIDGAYLVLRHLEELVGVLNKLSERRVDL